uniref:Galectin domain-containing protein n=1 Tax=Globodera rostochiensis TaxID=31243 RepID=A0A914HDC0_GLORO
MCFHAAQAQEETKPTRLTGLGKNCSTIPVALLDQCFPHEESKTFGIEFRLPPTGGSCADGLIICYTGSLATRTLDNAHNLNGLSVNSKLFNVNNAVNNALGKYCAGLNVPWHGIKVHTEKSNGKNIIKLSTSLLKDKEQSFEIPDAHRQFIIHFGNENEFSAYVTVEGQRIDLDVEKTEQYKQLAPNGAHLKDFVGLWTLGLDMLPWMDHEVKLFINRSCSCSMEAWFIRPTDREPNDPKEPSTGIGGSKGKCIAKTAMEVPLNNNLKANHLIRIQMLIDGNALDNSISFELLDLGKKNSPMTFTISTRQAATIKLKGLSAKEMVNVLPKGNGTRHADFIIALTEFSYGIVMNKMLLGDKEFLPEKWWNGLPFNDMKALRLRGKFLLLTDPLVMPFETFGQRNYKPQQLKLPYWQRISIFQEGTNVIFQIKLHSINNNFNIYFLHNRIESPKDGDLIGAEIRTFNVRPMDNKIITSSNEKKNDTFLIDFNTFGEKLEAQKAYEFIITVYATKFTFKLNDVLSLYFPHNLPIWATNFIAVEGNVTLLAKPYVIAPPKKASTDELSSDFAIKLKTLLDYNDKIQLKLTSGSKIFQILLLHDGLKSNKKIGFVVLQMIFSFEGGNCQLICNFTEEHQSIISPVPGRLNKYGQEFYMEITALDGNFNIQIEEVGLNHSCPSPKSKGNAAFYPPSAVDYIRNCPPAVKCPATNCPPAVKCLATNCPPVVKCPATNCPTDGEMSGDEMSAGGLGDELSARGEMSADELSTGGEMSGDELSARGEMSADELSAGDEMSGDELSVGGEMSATNCPSAVKCPATNFPPAFQSHVKVHAMNVTHPPAYEQRNMKQINDTSDLMKAGDLITVKLAIKTLKDSASVAINFFHEALQFHAIIGNTVMKVMLNEDAIYFSSSKPLINNSTNEQKYANGRLDKKLKKLEIRVGVTDDGFNVTLTWNNASSTMYTYNDGLPEWAVQYITLEHNNVTLSKPPKIFCVPEKRCMAPMNRTEQYNIEKDSIWI